MATYDAYLPEWEEFLKTNAPLMSRKELTEAFNARFGTSKSKSAIAQACTARGFNSSNSGRFEKGHRPWFEGMSSEERKSHYTEESLRRAAEAAVKVTKKLKVGDEFIWDGVPHIVVSVESGVPLKNRLYPKRRYVWEKLHGAIPTTHCIICLDGDLMNCDPSNLYCIPKSFKAILSRNKWWFANAEMTLAAIKWCELHFAIKEAVSND